MLDFAARSQNHFNKLLCFTAEIKSDWIGMLAVTGQIRSKEAWWCLAQLDKCESIASS